MSGLFAGSRLLKERIQEYGPISILGRLGCFDEIYYFAPAPTYWYGSPNDEATPNFKRNFEDQKNLPVSVEERLRKIDADGISLPVLSRVEILTMFLSSIMPLLRQPFEQLVLCGYSFGAHMWSFNYPVVKRIVAHHHPGSQVNAYTNRKVVLLHMGSALMYPSGMHPSVRNAKFGPTWSLGYTRMQRPAFLEELQVTHGSGHPLILKAMRTVPRLPSAGDTKHVNEEDDATEVEEQEWHEDIHSSVLPLYQSPDVRKQFIFDSNVHFVCGAEDSLFPIDCLFHHPMPLPPVPTLNLTEPVTDESKRGVRPLVNATYAHLFRRDVVDAEGGEDLLLKFHRQSPCRCNLYIVPGNHVAMVTSRLDATEIVLKHIFQRLASPSLSASRQSRL